MVLKIGDIIEDINWNRCKYHITNITRTRVICTQYYKNNQIVGCVHGRKGFESNDWKPAEIKWY